jgi:hypothetical protein
MGLCVLLLALLPSLAWANVQLLKPVSGFYYPADMPLRYQQLKQVWLSTHANAIPTLQQLANLATLANKPLPNAPPVWLPLTQWRLVGAPNPWVITPRVPVQNWGEGGELTGARVNYTVWVKLGTWYPSAPTALLDMSRLGSTAYWQLVKQATLTLPPQPANSDVFYALPTLSVLGWLQAYPDRWPLQAKLKIELITTENGQPRLVDTATTLLSLHPDCFALPIYLY